MSSWKGRIVASLALQVLTAWTAAAAQGALPRVQFITPEGDPGSQPVIFGQGQNQFVFDSSARGVLTIRMRVKLLDRAGSDHPESDFRFDVQKIPDSSARWDDEARDGRGIPTLVGNELRATVRFIGLPRRFSDFGPREAMLLYRDTKIAAQAFEVFYDATAYNHPAWSFKAGKCEQEKVYRTRDSAYHKPRGDWPTPNWFHYYRQNAIDQKVGCGLYHYACSNPREDSKVPFINPAINLDGRSRSMGMDGEGEETIGICEDAYDQRNTYLLTDPDSDKLTITGQSDEILYYTSFIGVLVHELEHVRNNIPSKARPDLDYDSDGLPDDRERKFRTDPERPRSTLGLAQHLKDSEVVAGSHVEKCAVQRADSTRDWAAPGSRYGIAQSADHPKPAGHPADCLRLPDA